MFFKYSIFLLCVEKCHQKSFYRLSILVNAIFVYNHNSLHCAAWITKSNLIKLLFICLYVRTLIYLIKSLQMLISNSIL